MFASATPVGTSPRADFKGVLSMLQSLISKIEKVSGTSGRSDNLHFTLIKEECQDYIRMRQVLIKALKALNKRFTQYINAQSKKNKAGLKLNAEDI